LKELEHLGVGSEIMRLMTEALRTGTPEQTVVAAFLAALQARAVAIGVSRHLLRALRRVKSTVNPDDLVYKRLASLVRMPTPLATRDVPGQ
jgi:hypothetical protein